MTDVPYEIERKFLLAAPDEAELESLATSVSRIEQTYLRNDDGHAERVRRRTVRVPGRDGEEVALTHTRKVGVSKGVVEEYERTLDETEYAELLTRIDDERLPLAEQRIQTTLAAYRGGRTPLSEVLVARRMALDLRMERIDLHLSTARLWAQLAYLIPAEPAAAKGVTP